MPHLRRPSSVDRQPSAVDLPPSTGHRAAPPPPSTPLLRSYFRSGWAFLIPYLAVYLLYAWQKWPANPVAGDSPPSTVLSSPSTVFWLPIPPLLYVYWALHAINLVLAAIALRSWWKEAQSRAVSGKLSAQSSTNSALNFQRSTLNLGTTDTPGPSPFAPSPSRLALGRAAGAETASSSLLALRGVTSSVLPWLLLTALFAIPGVYLEWPSDPWEHLRRITEWATHPLVANHSAGYKSFYFFAYSWVGSLSPIHLMSWLNVYYVGVSLLLAWQYYLLAKAVGLDRRWAFLSVLVNVLTFGNSCFSFYRYYALASTIFAQIGAVALTRIALEYAKSIGQSAEGQGQKVKGEERWNSRPLPVTGSAEQSRVSGESQESKALPRRFWNALSAFPALFTVGRLPSAVYSAATPPLSTGNRPPCGSATPYSLLATRSSLLRLGAASSALLLLIAYNHLQGLGVAGLGVTAVILWRLIEWKRSMIFWLGATAVLFSVAAVLWWPRQPQIDAVFRPGGWLNAWLGFNLFAWPSPAADRMMQILGLFGLLNLVAGLILLRRNHVIGWLALTPIIALSLPFIAIPFANSIATEIIVYHRMLFAIPASLALVGCFSLPGKILRQSSQSLEFLTVIGVIALLATVSPGNPLNNRLWNSLTVIPNDLQLKPIVSACETSDLQRQDTTYVITTGLGTGVIESLFHVHLVSPFRVIGQPTSDLLNIALDRIPALGDTVHWTPTAKIVNIPRASSGAFDQTTPSSSAHRDSYAATHSPNQGEASFAVSDPKRMNVESDIKSDPLAVTPSNWTSLSGATPEFVTEGFISSQTSTALQNPVGRASQVFDSALLRVDRTKTYRLEIDVRQQRGPAAPTYLAVAWYNAAGSLLPSSEPSPRGAGFPSGWTNGTYSYFGLLATAAPKSWTTYDISFGVGETAEIPSRAQFVKIGALLNYNATPLAVVQLSNLHLSEIPTPDITVVIPQPKGLFTPASQAALASGHWPPQQVTSDEAGAKEIEKGISAHDATATTSRGANIYTLLSPSIKHRD